MVQSSWLGSPYSRSEAIFVKSIGAMVETLGLWQTISALLRGSYLAHFEQRELSMVAVSVCFQDNRRLTHIRSKSEKGEIQCIPHLHNASIDVTAYGRSNTREGIQGQKKTEVRSPCYSEISPNEIFRRINLAVSVDPEKAKAEVGEVFSAFICSRHDK
jgi:hypothetical protein